MVTKRYGKDFMWDSTYSAGSEAYTLNAGIVGRNSSGWTVKADIVEDWYEWVNDFEASHPDYGRVWGDFENEVHADSEEGFAHFFEHHPPESWDYWDI